MTPKIIRQLRQVAPHRWLVAGFGLLYLLSYCIDYLLVRKDMFVRPAELTTYMRVAVIGYFSAGHGVLRGSLFHPFRRSEYVLSLVLSPWKWGKELPRGPVHLVWGDVVVMSLVTGLAFLNAQHMPLLPVAVFLAAYLFSLGLFFCKTGPLWVIMLWSFMAPFAVYPHKNTNIAVLVLVVMYGIGYLGLRCFFKGFPWNTSFWKSDPVKEMRDRAIAQHIRWSYRKLNINKSVSISFKATVVLSIIVTWWLHVASWLDGETVSYKFVVFCAAFMAMIRWGVYVGCPRFGCYCSPISFWGRIFTGRLIIPRYDQVFICPICILLAGIFAPRLFALMGVAAGFSAELTLFVVLVLALGMPPNLKKWRLISASRITRPVSRRRSTKATVRSSRKSTFKSALAGGIRQ